MVALFKKPKKSKAPTNEDIVTFVKGQYKYSKDYYQTLRDDWDIYYQNYRGIPNAKKYDWQSNLFIPITAKQVDSTLSDIAPALLGVTTPFDVRPREKSDKEHAGVVKSLLDYQWADADAFIKLIFILQQAIMYGTGIGKIPWDTKTNNPAIIPIDVYNLFPDPDAIEIEDGWVVHRLERSMDYLKKRQEEGVYENVDKITDKSFSSVDDVRQGRRDILGWGSPSAGKRTKPIEVLEYSGMYDLNGDGKEVYCILTIANKKVLLRKQKFPYDHGESLFIKINYISVANEFYGIGIPERILCLQDELNDVRNQRMDNVNLILNKMFAIDKNADVNTKDFVSRPGGFIRGAGNPSEWFKELDLKDVTNSAYKEEGIIKDDAQDATGSYEYAYGASPARQETATGIIRLQSAASKRFAIIARIMEYEGIKKIIKKMYQLDLQFIKKSRVIRIVGKEGDSWLDVTPEDIKGNFDFIPTGMSGLADKEAQINQIIQALNIVPNLPEIDPMAVFKKLWELWGFKDFEDLRKPQQPEQPDPEASEEDKEIIEKLREKGITDPRIIKYALREKDEAIEGKRIPPKEGRE